MNSEIAILEKKPLDDAKKKFKRRHELDDDSSSEDERTDNADLPSRNVASSVQRHSAIASGGPKAE